MKTVNVHEAKTHLSRLLDRVAAGEEIILAKAGEPVACLVPYHRHGPKRVPGAYQDEIWMADDFTAPLPADLQALFDGETSAPKRARKRK